MEMKKKIFYICNKKKCNNCGSECNRTSDIKYSKNYSTEPTNRILKKKFVNKKKYDSDFSVYDVYIEKGEGE